MQRQCLWGHSRGWHAGHSSGPLEHLAAWKWCILPGTSPSKLHLGAGISTGIPDAAWTGDHEVGSPPGSEPHTQVTFTGLWLLGSEQRLVLSSVPELLLCLIPLFPSLFPLDRLILLHLVAFPHGASLVLLFRGAGPYLGVEVMISLDTASSFHPRVLGWPWQVVAVCEGLQGRETQDFQVLLHLGAITLKSFLSEEIQVVSLLPWRRVLKRPRSPVQPPSGPAGQPRPGLW